MRGVRAAVDRVVAFPVLVTGLLVAVALVLSRTTSDLRWPFDVDLFRDIGQADAVRRGHLFADANYAGERAWYNPLGSWLVGGLSYVTGISPATLITRGGVVFNLITPISLAILVRRWFGRLAAGFTLVAFVFLICGQYPSWVVATYSPWMFQAGFAQGFFYLALLALARFAERGRRVDCMVFGALVGVVVLAHTAPALILVAVSIVTSVWVVRTGRATTLVAVRRLALAGATAFVVASPFLVPLAWRYRFHIRNDLPSSWQWPQIDNAHIAGFAWDFVFRWPVVIGAIGVAWWFWQRRGSGRLDDVTPAAMVALLTWTGTALVGLVAATYRASPVPGKGLVPSVVPSYHFVLYLSAASCVWFGIGSAALVRAVLDRIPARVPVPYAAAALAVVMAAVAFPGWLDRDDRNHARNTSIAIAAATDDFAVSDWIAAETRPRDVVLYDLDPSEALEVGALDARPTVVVDANFSNPFVDLAPRAEAAMQMVAALSACDEPRFQTIATEYDVRYVVTGAAGPLARSTATCEWIAIAYTDRYATVIAVAPARR
jgi:hypothetical protein